MMNTGNNIVSLWQNAATLLTNIPRSLDLGLPSVPDSYSLASSVTDMISASPDLGWIKSQAFAAQIPANIQNLLQLDNGTLMVGSTLFVGGVFAAYNVLPSQIPPADRPIQLRGEDADLLRQGIELGVIKFEGMGNSLLYQLGFTETDISFLPDLAARQKLYVDEQKLLKNLDFERTSTEDLDSTLSFLSQAFDSKTSYLEIVDPEIKESVTKALIACLKPVLGLPLFGPGPSFVRKQPEKTMELASQVLFNLAISSEDHLLFARLYGTLSGRYLPSEIRDKFEEPIIKTLIDAEEVELIINDIMGRAPSTVSLRELYRRLQAKNLDEQANSLLRDRTKDSMDHMFVDFGAQERAHWPCGMKSWLALTADSKDKNKPNDFFTAYVQNSFFLQPRREKHVEPILKSMEKFLGAEKMRTYHDWILSTDEVPQVWKQAVIKRMQTG